MSSVGSILLSNEKGRKKPNVAQARLMWEAAYMPVEEKTALQRFVGRLIDDLPRTRNFYDSEIQKILGTTGKPLYDLERKGSEPRRDTLKAMAQVLGQPLELFLRALDGEQVEPSARQEVRRDHTGGRASDGHTDLEMVGIQHADLDFGLGAVFTDGHVEVEVLQFPRKWVETITYSPAELLTWARGRGDSMTPTIHDGDLVMIDRSQRHVREQDAIWAFSVGDVGSIKRLRVKGDKFIILSDNPAVPDDEEPQDFVRIVGRVVFVGAKK